MAQWKETLEPYVKVYETVKSSTLNPSAGGELIIGCALISDAGPSVPTLITSQSEFLSTYSSADITADYINKLDQLYKGADKKTASTMWTNAYRLAGSNTLLCVRASKANDIYFSKPLSSSDLNTYISRDGELMKKVDSFRIDIDTASDNTSTASTGWAISINGVGIFGNYTTDAGAQYDYYVDNLVDLVDKLNETSKFFSPAYTFYGKHEEKANDDGTIETKANKLNVDSDSSDSEKKNVKYVTFEEVYLGYELIDTTALSYGFCNISLSTVSANEVLTDSSVLINNKINSAAWSGFKASDYYATNVFNSASDLKVRIRRFNHDAVIQKSVSGTSLNNNSESPWVVLGNVLDTYTSNGTVALENQDESIRNRDFYEVAVMDPSISAEPLFFNIGKIPGRGDMEASEVNDNLKMIQLVLPDDMTELNLNYYDYTTDDSVIYTELKEYTGTAIEVEADASGKPAPEKAEDGVVYKVGDKYFSCSVTISQIYANLTIDPSESHILDVSDSDLKKALDKISLDEVYVTEGLCDLGNTELSFQNYMANMAINENYFYPISTVNSTNYMTIANNASKISQDSYKLYLSAPWDIDTGTMGWKNYMSPSVLYWEAVARNRRNNEEFRGILGQSGGIVQYQKPLIEFNKKTRQLLLSRRINTVLWNTQTSAWNMNDNYTKQSVENIMSDDGNSRLAIRISKAMPILLRQFIGRKINAKLWADTKGVIDYWFRSTILPMQYTVAEYLIIVDETNNPEELQRQNKMAVTVNVRYANTLKYITVYHNILEVGMDISAL